MTDNAVALLLKRMFFVIENPRQKISEHCFGFFKFDSVFFEVSFSFFDVPFKLHF